MDHLFHDAKPSCAVYLSCEHTDNGTFFNTLQIPLIVCIIVIKVEFANIYHLSFQTSYFPRALPSLL